MLIDKGFTLVRPLAGGLDAWIAAGLPVEGEPLVAIRQAKS
jgi:rhodanese-related sulfurtransferase